MSPINKRITIKNNDESDKSDKNDKKIILSMTLINEGVDSSQYLAERYFFDLAQYEDANILNDAQQKTFENIKNLALFGQRLIKNLKSLIRLVQGDSKV